MTQAQLARNSAAGKACAEKYGRDYMASLGKKGGSMTKAIVYTAPAKNKKEERPTNHLQMLLALSRKRNLREGGLQIGRKLALSHR